MRYRCFTGRLFACRVKKKNDSHLKLTHKHRGNIFLKVELSDCKMVRALKNSEPEAEVLILQADGHILL